MPFRSPPALEGQPHQEPGEEEDPLHDDVVAHEVADEVGHRLGAVAGRRLQYPRVSSVSKCSLAAISGQEACIR